MRLFLLAVALSGVCGVAQAQSDRHQADQLFVANSGPRGEFTYKQGEDVLKLPLVWEHAAKLAEGVTVVTGDRTTVFAAGDVLPRETLLTEKGGSVTFIAYCTQMKPIVPQLAGDVGLGQQLGSMFWRSVSDGQTCLADRDGDGRFEQSLVVGAGWGDMRTPRPITPIGYEAMDQAPISPKDEVRIRLSGVSPTTAAFVLEIVQRGKAMPFDTMSSDSGDTPRKTKVPIQSLPARVEILGAVFDLVAADPAAKTVTLRWPENASKEVRAAISDTIYYTRRF